MLLLAPLIPGEEPDVGDGGEETVTGRSRRQDMLAVTANHTTVDKQSPLPHSCIGFILETLSRRQSRRSVVDFGRESPQQPSNRILIYYPPQNLILDSSTELPQPECLSSPQESQGTRCPRRAVHCCVQCGGQCGRPYQIYAI